MRIVIISSRISGTDGVSLEAEHWRQILTRMGHKVRLVAGKLDRAGIIIPELYFQSPQVVKIHDKVVYSKNDFHDIEAKVFEIAGKIEGLLRENMGNGSKPDLLVVANVLSLPMHFPLAVAVTRFIEELKIPTIARHHDFWWERERFLRSSMFGFFKRWFPPDSSLIKHVTINSRAQKELKKRTGIDSEVIWDSFDFASNLARRDGYCKHWREDFGLCPDDIVFLQATRIVPRKRIELAIKLVKKLKNPKVILVISGYSGDEGNLYEKTVRKLAKESGIRYRFVGRYVNTKRRIVKIGKNGHTQSRRVYTLWDCFRNSDFVVYPTQKEGFGNQFVETMYFKKPIILTPYPVYKKDIKPLGFETIEMDENIDKKTLSKVNSLIFDDEEKKLLVEKNFEIGKRYLSYGWVEGKLRKIFREQKLI
jgi:glycosyltransferase involved in cell wall biosynthesis